MAPRTAEAPSVAEPLTITAAKCGMCNGDGGTWETSDGNTPGKNISRWIKCTGCDGRGTV